MKNYKIRQIQSPTNTSSFSKGMGSWVGWKWLSTKVDNEKHFYFHILMLKEASMA